MKYFYLLFFFFYSLAHAQETFNVDINILDLCPADEVEKDCKACLVLQPVAELPLADNSFLELQKNMNKVLIQSDPSQEELKNICKDLKVLGRNQTFKPIEIKQKDQDGDEWNIKFFFGYTRTEYFNSPTVKLRSTRVNVDIKDFDWTERHSFEYFNKEKLKGKGNTFRFIDEPTNSFFINFEKGKNVYTFSLLHYKYVMTKDQDKHVTGTIDGVAVDGVMPLNPEFDGYNNKPGEMHLLRLENTYQQVNPQIGYGRKIDIVSSPKYGKLSYTPSVQVGFIGGGSYSAFTKEGEYWVSDNKAQKFEIKGATFTAGHRIEYEKGRLSAFMDQKFTTSKIKQDFLDGTATYRLNYMPVTLGVGIKIFKKAKVIPPVVEP